MRAGVAAALAALGSQRRQVAQYGFNAPERTGWSYTPRGHAGISLAEMDLDGRKEFHRLLATALSRAAFAQAVAIMGLEEVLDLDEAGRLGRHGSGYYLAVFGDPAANRFCWRIEGHHLSVTATVVGDAASVGPVFLGARPHRVRSGRTPVLAPLDAEEMLARELVAALPTELHREAVITAAPPTDICSSNSEAVDRELLRPSGIAAAKLGDDHLRILADLVALYIGRIAPQVQPRSDTDALHFAFLGRNKAGAGYYYRITGPQLLIEYCNTDGDHAHTVLRTPGGDFGHDLLAAGSFEEG